MLPMTKQGDGPRQKAQGEAIKNAPKARTACTDGEMPRLHSMNINSIEHTTRMNLCTACLLERTAKQAPRMSSQGFEDEGERGDLSHQTVSDPDTRICSERHAQSPTSCCW